MGLGRALETSSATVQYISLAGLAKKNPAVERMPLTLKVLLESVIRQLDGSIITEEHVQNLLDWRGQAEAEMPFKPVMQDFTGVPAVVDLAVMRDVFASLGGDPKKINPLIPVDLVIDHSVQVDLFGSLEAFAYNAKREFERNRERYEFLRWASEVFDNFTVVPPATGIVHQVNLEYLAKVVQTQQQGNETVAYPDTLLGTDSHTTMINGIGVLGWGVGGIEAEAAILGQPLFMRLPEVIGFRMTGHLREGVTATDLMLTVTERLREYGVVGRFVEFFGPGLEGLSLADRATISNMCPEFGANSALFPVDESSIRYMRVTGRSDSLIDLVERYTKEQGLCRSSVEPEYTNFLEFDLAAVSTSIAGPKRPQDRIELHDSKGRFRDFLQAIRAGDRRENSVQLGGGKAELSDGAVVIWAITSCTNTSNPHVMVGAGLLAKKAVEKGLKVPPYVKTSLAPGSRVVTRYLELSGLTPYLEELGYHFVGYGCTTCIGNSGPLDERISRAILDNDVVACAVLSRNRNFEGRIHPEVRANYLASPLLVVAYGLAGTVEIDLDNDPLGQGKDGPVYLWDIWPSQSEVEQIVGELVTPNLSAEEYGNVYTGNEIWNSIQLSGGDLYDWQESSTYIRKPPFFDGLTKQLPSARPIQGTRVLAVLGDSVTTDHISPAGMIPYDSPATEWLRARGVEFRDFNTFGSRRGNHLHAAPA
jgi:aconitate hydratase